MAFFRDPVVVTLQRPQFARLFTLPPFFVLVTRGILGKRRQANCRQLSSSVALVVVHRLQHPHNYTVVA